MRLYEPDRELPGIQLLFDTDALARRIGLWLGNDARFKLTIANIRYKPKTSCLVSYVAESQRGTTHLHAKAFQHEDWKVRKQKFPVPSDNHWIDDDLAVVLTRFPNDSVLPGIESLIRDPRTFLERVVPQAFEAGRFEKLTNLAYKPNRRYTGRLDFEQGQKLAIKVYGPSEFEQVITTVNALKKLPFAFPRRIGKSMRNRAVAFEWLNGETLDFSTTATGDVDNLMGLICDYLDRLHSTIGKSAPRLAKQKPNGGLAAIASYIGEIHPPSTKIAQLIHNQIQSAQISASYKPELIHGDFHAQQILLDATGVVACDFDDCCLSDRTLDLANFLAHLHYRVCVNQLSSDSVSRATEFADSHYESHSLKKRLQWNQMASMFRLATNPFRSGSPNWVIETEGFLQYLWQEIVSLGKSRGPLPLDKSRSSKQDQIQSRILEDDRFDFLADAFDLKASNQIVHRDVPEFERALGPYEVSKITVQRHKPGRRCIIEYRLNTDRGSRAILGKSSVKRLDRKAFETQSSLFEKHGFDYGSVDGLSVPAVFGCCPRWNIWFQEKIDAVAGIEFLDKDRLSTVTTQIADAIFKLHSCGFRPTRQHTTADELEILVVRLTQVIGELPTDSNQIERVLRNCMAICSDLDEQPVVPIHRDFYHDQIMFSPDRTYLVDLDLVSLGHPAIDVGNFLAHLTEHAIRVHDDPQYWQAEENQIATRYQMLNPSCTLDEILACKALSLARHISISWQMPKRRKWTPTIIDSADQLTCDCVATDSPINFS